MRQYDDIAMRIIQFLVTEDCNLDCVYCYEKQKSQKALSAQFMKDIIYQQMVEGNGYKELSIDFFGGEPLLEFETIKEVVEWFHQVKWPQSSKAYRFVITTNGTLLDEDKKSWFTKYSNVLTLCLSLDGTPEAHNLNRSNSYDTVIKNIDFFKKNWPEQPVKMTISQYTLNQMYAGIVHIHKLGLQVEADVVFENVWGNEDARKKALRTYAEELEKLVVFYYKNPDLPRPRLINKNIMSLYGRKARGNNMFCGAGKHLICWTGDGSKYPCMRFAPICTSSPLQDISFSRNNLNEKCQVCIFESLCQTCEGHNFEVTGSCFYRTDFHCDFFKLEMLASARLFFLENQNDLFDMDSNKDSEENILDKIRKILAIKTINDSCSVAIGID